MVITLDKLLAPREYVPKIKEKLNKVSVIDKPLKDYVPRGEVKKMLKRNPLEIHLAVSYPKDREEILKEFSQCLVSSAEELVKDGSLYVLVDSLLNELVERKEELTDYLDPTISIRQLLERKYFLSLDLMIVKLENDPIRQLVGLAFSRVGMGIIYKLTDLLSGLEDTTLAESPTLAAFRKLIAETKDIFHIVKYLNFVLNRWVVGFNPQWEIHKKYGLPFYHSHFYSWLSNPLLWDAQCGKRPFVIAVYNRKVIKYGQPIPVRKEFVYDTITTSKLRTAILMMLEEENLLQKIDSEVGQLVMGFYEGLFNYDERNKLFKEYSRGMRSCNSITEPDVFCIGMGLAKYYAKDKKNYNLLLDYIRGQPVDEYIEPTALNKLASELNSPRRNYTYFM